MQKIIEKERIDAKQKSSKVETEKASLLKEVEKLKRELDVERKEHGKVKQTYEENKN